jgi:hypothetical protein
MFWGLPEAAFERGLLWSLTESVPMKHHPHLWMEFPYRGRELPVLLKTFPSWSSVSWLGRTTYETQDRTMVTFVKWYKHNTDGSLEPVNNFRMAHGNESCEESRNIMLGWNSQDFSLQADLVPLYSTGRASRAWIPDCLYSRLHLRSWAFPYTGRNSSCSFLTHYVMCSDQMDSQQIYAH